MSHRGLSQRPKPPAAGDLPDVASAEATDGAGSLTAKTVDDPYTISYFVSNRNSSFFFLFYLYVLF